MLARQMSRRFGRRLDREDALVLHRLGFDPHLSQPLLHAGSLVGQKGLFLGTVLCTHPQRHNPQFAGEKTELRGTRVAEMRRSVRAWGNRYFDGRVKAMQREAAARLSGGSTEHDFLRHEHAEALLDRLDDIKDGRFVRVLDATKGSGVMSRVLREGRNEVAQVVSEGQECDLAVSLLSMHWEEDLDAELERVRQSLKPDSPFVGCMWSTGTLAELRSCLTLADMERLGGAVPRTSPLAGPDDLAGALAANGFVGVSIDQADSVPTYSSVATLLEELFFMGERGALAQPGRISRDSLTGALALYPHLYGDENGRLPATFRALWWIAWNPGPNAPRSKRRGSATRSLKELAAPAQTKKD